MMLMLVDDNLHGLEMYVLSNSKDIVLFKKILLSMLILHKSYLLFDVHK